MEMDTSMDQDEEEPLSSFLSVNDKNNPAGTAAAESENLDAIKKFIEEQEKEIQQIELEEKRQKQLKIENAAKQKKIDECKNKIETHVDKSQENFSSQSLNETDKTQVDSNIMNMILPESEILNNNETKAGECSKKVKKSDKKVAASGSSKERKLMSPDKGKGSISLSVGCKVEVKSFEGDWYAAEVAEVDYDEMEVLVQYEIDLKKPDEWVSVNSSRLRPFTGNTAKPKTLSEKNVETSLNDSTEIKQDTGNEKEKITPNDPLPAVNEVTEHIEEPVKVEDKQKVTFEVGERCLARWRDNKRFCATVHKDLGDGNFEVVFDDGFHWTCSIVRLHKMKADALSVDTSFHSAGSPSPLLAGGAAVPPQASPGITPAFHTHLFDPTRDYLGSKSERRERKRKLNIKEIFNIGQKKFKKKESEETPKNVTPKQITPKVLTPKTSSPRPPPSKKPRILKRNVTPKTPKIAPKKEDIIQVPDAAKSIAGSVKDPVVEICKLDPGLVAKPDNVAQNTTIAKECNEFADDYNIVVEPESCIVNPNDDTLDDEDTEEPKSEGDPVLEEEVTLENFDSKDTEKHVEVIDKIKEAIIKLEGGMADVENKSPQVERVMTPVKELDTPKVLEIPKQNIKADIKEEDLKDALAEVAASIGEPDLAAGQIKLEHKEKPKKESKMKKGKKLRLLQEKKVKRQVEKVKSELEEMKRQFEEMRQRMMSQEFVQGVEMAPLPESFLSPGEWCCRWVNGQPVGRVSEIEGAPPGPDQKQALPRRSVQVEDKRLPPGWTKHMVRRSGGNSAGKWDVVLVSPEQFGNRRFHTKTDMRHFLETLTDDDFKKEYEHALMDFGVHLKVSRRMGWVVNTPDGITEGPETILPANTTCNMSPLVKRKSLSADKKRSIRDKKRAMRRDKNRRPIKLKLQKGLHTYKAQLIGEGSIAEPQDDCAENMLEQSLMPLEDGYVYVGSLKVQIIENLLRCPAEGCFKNFRTKTLLQMHIKHYHRELTAMMGATPKVLDLAYARQRVLPSDSEPQLDKKIIKVKINRPPKREDRPPEQEAPIDPPFVRIEEKIPRSQDSPKLRQALSHKPVKRPKVLLPVRRLDLDGHSDSMNDDSEPCELPKEIPIVPNLDFETAISTHTVTKPPEKKSKKADKKKCFASVAKNLSEDEEWFAMTSDELDTRSSFPCSSPDGKLADSKLPSLTASDDQKDSQYTYTDTGERIKIVHMKREEIINCQCGVREEDGLMVQCELCLCWQHALCHNIQREAEVPDKYTCSICLNPRRGRRSKRFLHDQDRMYEGLLPGAKPCETLRRSHELSGNLLRIEDALHALRVKYYVATKKDHPKLYLWAAEWDQAEAQYTQQKLNSEYSDLSVVINGVDKENHPLVDALGARTPPADDQDERSQRGEGQLGAALGALLASPADLELPLSATDLDRLASSVQECGEWRAPQPEAAIESGACRARLLRHIQRCHALLDTRLDFIEAQVAELESQDPSFGEDGETAESYPRTKHTIQMLMRDLATMEELGVIT